jgi:drug/metabolite transporter (DMT)-like permease
MSLLFAASLIWAFSFGMIKHALAGVNPLVIAFVRLALSLLLFLPFARAGTLSGRDRLGLTLIGAVQYGVMYMAYIASYAYLQAYQVALFTVLTPLYVAVFDRARSGRGAKRFALLAAGLAVAGAACILAENRDPRASLAGFVLLQGANVCFAFGQTAYRRMMRARARIEDWSVFAWLYLGAAGVCAIPAALAVWQGGVLPQGVGWAALLYLGLIPSGLAFFLWNRGARHVAGTATLAVMNNAKIPLGVLVSLLVFGERARWPQLLVGSAAIAAAAALSYAKASRENAKKVFDRPS